MKVTFFAEVDKGINEELVKKIQKHCVSITSRFPDSVIIYSFKDTTVDSISLPPEAYILLGAENVDSIQIAAFLVEKFNRNVIKTNLDTLIDNLDWIDESTDMILVAENDVTYYNKDVFQKAEAGERLKVVYERDIKFEKI